MLNNLRPKNIRFHTSVFFGGPEYLNLDSKVNEVEFEIKEQGVLITARKLVNVTAGRTIVFVPWGNIKSLSLESMQEKKEL